jgi:hypothetical protein
MNKKRQILLSVVLASALASNAQVTINVDTSNPGIKVSPNLYGIFFEDINHAADTHRIPYRRWYGSASLRSYGPDVPR